MPTGIETRDSGSAAHSASSEAGIAAPYGRACTNCSRAKCKCILRPVGGACERCHRLSKTCQPSNPIRRRSKKPPSSRTAQLEEKLDGLVTLLRQSGRPDLPADLGVDFNIPGVIPSSSSTATTKAVREPSSDMRRSSEFFSASSHGDGGGGNDRTRADSLPTPTQTASPEGPGYGDELPSPDEAEALFEAFRGQNLKYFPFLNFRATMTAQELRAERPFLWICIMTVASRVSSQQLALGQRVRQIVSQKLVVENERSIDYLLGLLVILGWANHQLGNKPFMCLFCQIAIGLIFDLGISRDPLDGLNPFLCWKAAQERATQEKTGMVCPTLYVKSQMPRTMEQRRAVVAGYLVTSAVASFLGKMDPLRWTSHMDECLQILDEQPESPSDRSLAALVKMQLLKDEAGKLSSRSDAMLEAMDGPKTPMAMYVKVLQTQLQRIIQSLPSELQSTDSIIAQLHCTELAIQETALSTKTGACVPANLPDVARLDIFYACLHAVKAWFDHFFTLPPAAYFSIPFLCFAQLSHCTVALYRLSVLEDPVWDRASVRSTIDLIATLDEVGDRFGRVCAEVGLDVDVEDGNAFTKAVKTIKGLRSTWEAAMAPLAKADPAAAASGVSGAGPGMLTAGGVPMPAGLGEVEMGQLGLELMDNRWFTDIFTPFDF
ncbi:Putative zn(2)Cys(6) fungal-type DNA-binding domain-containing protein [Colletotrichum destructivum]|uniref:Zn(2)Cys(6) fungal-type DNA-binding domain-containing protein n=1 Tax=Colletotrichum destructivum TaxID=34406 RepID=A0AAX4ICK0_9PEZI|nr:Putative zn(2)Cys(6) fungal-type DNA-binding domain-containing protein [Colletotrichum destructivum]